MDGKKGVGSDPGTPGSELTREQVMAQRAEKKKLKEAKKNKSLTSTDGGNPEPNKQTPKAKVTTVNSTSVPLEKSQLSETSKDASLGQSTTPDSQLSREEVMAQRAEKKKIKEARKNKSLVSTDGGTPEPKKTEKAKAKTVNSPAAPSKASELSKTSKDAPSGDSTPPKAATEGSKTSKDTSSGLPTTEKSTTEDAETAKDASSGQSTTLKAPTEDSKAGTPERSSLGSKSVVDFQSTIQSLFTVNAAPSGKKDLTFQLHPLFHNLGVKLIHNVIRGTNLRCVKLLESIKEYVRCYETPSGMSFKHGLSNDLKMNMDTLRRKCPFAIGMNNAVEHLNAFLYKLDQDVKDIHEQKDNIRDEIDVYVEEKIEKAVEAIVLYGVEKVRSGDVIMIYSITEAVLNLLEKAANGDEGEEGKSFELIIIHTPETMLDIPVLLKKLDEPIKKRSVTISSVNFSNAIYRMRHCTKIVIGGHGLFTTGGVMAQSGSGKLALLASTFNKPAIFLCETYKFCDRSPLDFFTLDEYIAEQSITEDGLFEPKIKYDVTPANLVTVVITDIDMLPSTSVPVVLRVQEGRAPKKTEDSFDTSC